MVAKKQSFWVCKMVFSKSNIQFKTNVCPERIRRPSSSVSKGKNAVTACSSTFKTMYILACKNDGDCGEATLGGTLRTQGCFEGVCRGKCFLLNDFTCLENFSMFFSKYTYIWYFHITLFTTLECTKNADCRAGLYCDSGHCRGKFSS